MHVVSNYKDYIIYNAIYNYTNNHIHVYEIVKKIDILRDI